MPYQGWPELCGLRSGRYRAVSFSLTLLGSSKNLHTSLVVWSLDHSYPTFTPISPLDYRCGLHLEITPLLLPPNDRFPVRICIIFKCVGLFAAMRRPSPLPKDKLYGYRRTVLCYLEDWPSLIWRPGQTVSLVTSKKKHSNNNSSGCVQEALC